MGRVRQSIVVRCCGLLIEVLASEPSLLLHHQQNVASFSQVVVNPPPELGFGFLPSFPVV
jgi:hypothetical protein